MKDQLDHIYRKVRGNRWFWYFAIFNRLILAAGFFPSGLVKIMGERFTSLHNNQPMGHYLEALYHTGYYYTFIGMMQVTAAILLLIPWTTLLGALIYFPIILNICILSFSVRFEGSIFTSPLMVLADLYLLCWDYDQIKHLLTQSSSQLYMSKRPSMEKHSFPIAFFGGVATIMVLFVFYIPNLFEIIPRNTLKDCQKQCLEAVDPVACKQFCDCIHEEGQPLNKCKDTYFEQVSRIPK